ncbi:putative reverse transcriptase domain-containing protein [Tanacetum coccineum]
MNRGFLDLGGKKNNHRKKMDTTTGTGSVTKSDGTLNNATPLVDSIEKEVVSPSVVDETVAKDKQSPLVNTTGLGSFPPLPTQETPSSANAPDMPSYANVTGKPIGKKLNFRTLFTPGRVAYPVVANYVRNTWSKYGLVQSMFSSSTGLFSFQFSFMEGLNAMLENGPWFIRNNPLILKKWHPDVNILKEDVGTPLMLDSYTSDMCMQSCGKSSYARAMIELRADVELRDNIVAAMPKITGEGYYTCNIRVKYEWKPPRCACYKVFGHSQEECPKNIGTGEMKNLKKTSQTPKEVSNSNPFDVLTSVENDVELGTNGGTLNLASQATNSSGSSFWNVDAISPSTTPVTEKIDKIEKLIIKGKVTLMDDDGKPLKKVDSSCDNDSEDEVASVDNDMAKFLAKKGWLWYAEFA